MTQYHVHSHLQNRQRKGTADINTVEGDMSRYRDGKIGQQEKNKRQEKDREAEE